MKIEDRVGSGVTGRTEQRAEMAFESAGRRVACELVAPLQFFRRNRRVTLAVGVVLEVALMLVFSPSLVSFPKGTPGAVGVAIAVLAAIGAGGAAGALVALAGWVAFFFLVTEQAVSSLIALPVWLATAYLVGSLADALLRNERELAEQELERIASHELRTPLATIVGLARVLRSRELSPEEHGVVELIEHEATTLLENFDTRRTDATMGETGREPTKRATWPTRTETRTAGTGH